MANGRGELGLLKMKYRLDIGPTSLQHTWRAMSCFCLFGNMLLLACGFSYGDSACYYVVRAISACAWLPGTRHITAPAAIPTAFPGMLPGVLA